MADKEEKIQRYTRKLYRKAGKINLYTCFCCKEDKPDNIRFKEEIEQIKQLIADIENEINER